MAKRKRPVPEASKDTARTQFIRNIQTVRRLQEDARKTGDSSKVDAYIKKTVFDPKPKKSN